MRSILTTMLLALALAATVFGGAEARADWNKIGVDARVHIDYAVRPLQSRNRGRGRGGEREASNVRISLDQAVNMVERRSDGKVIGARTERSGDRVTYRVKVLKQGKVRTYTVDATSGAIR